MLNSIHAISKASQSKIRDFDGIMVFWVVGIQQNVLWFYISMDNSMLVEISDNINQLGQNGLDFFLSELSPVTNGLD